MTLTFITNYLTHHTSPLSEALYGWAGGRLPLCGNPAPASRAGGAGVAAGAGPALSAAAYQGPEVLPGAAT